MFQEKENTFNTVDDLDPLGTTNDLSTADQAILEEINGKLAKNKVISINLPSTSNEESSSVKSTLKSKTIPKEEFKIRVGREFQAVCPPLVPVEDRNLESLSDRALTVWTPTENISDSMLQTYITLTHKKFGYNIEQALAMLYWHKFNMQAAIRDLENFAPFPEEWTREDKIIFEEALLFHGKNFVRIRELLPDKSVGGLIDYYYSWKKKRPRQRPVERRGRPRIEKKVQPNEMRLLDK